MTVLYRVLAMRTDVVDRDSVRRVLVIERVDPLARERPEERVVSGHTYHSTKVGDEIELPLPPPSRT